MSKLVDFFRAGYPDCVPRLGYVPLLAVLRRRLADDEFAALVDHVCGFGPPILHDDVDGAVRRLLRDATSDEEVQRVSRHLADQGWLVLEPSGRVVPPAVAESTARVEQVFADVCAEAVDLIPGADLAHVTLFRDGDVMLMAGTSELSERLTDLQRHVGEGPCAQAVTDLAVVRTDDFATESRWPRYAPAAVDLGLRSCLSFKLYCSGGTAATLNVFGTDPNVWDDEAETIGSVLAAHAAEAISASVWGAHLDAPLGDRERIGQAKGIIMERYGLDDVGAFEMLRRLAQETGVGLVDMACRVIGTVAERRFEADTVG